MTAASTCRVILSSTALGALVGLAPTLGGLAWAADAGADAIQPNQMRASQMIGDDVYNANDQEIGQVIDIVLDPSGQVAGVVIGIPASVGVGEKTVAVPMADIHSDRGHMRLDRTKDQLQQAQNYQLQGGSTGSGTSAPPAKGGQGAPAAGGGQPSGSSGK